MSKDEEQPKKKKSTLDKIVMGAIIGTAIGSAIGVTMAPQKGKETRKALKEHSGEAGKLTKETATGFWKLAKNLFRSSRKKKAKSDMKEIPNEMEIIPPEYVDRD